MHEQNRISSEVLTVLIIDALMDAKIVKNEDLQKAIEITVVAPSQPNPIFSINPPQQPSIAPPSNSIAPSSNNSMPCQVGQAQ
jgi:hypothetical protein